MKQNEYTKKVVVKWSRLIFKAMKSTVHVEGLENIPDSNVFLVGNHQSMMDIPALFAALKIPLGFVAKTELRKVPLIAQWIDMTGSVYINRNDMRQSMKAIVTATENLKIGYSMAIFPEGTRSKDGKVGDFKKGSFKPAFKTSTVILPVALDGTNVLLEDLKNLKIKPHDIKIKVFKPIYLDQLTDEEKKNVHNTIQSEIKEFVEN